jgi:hypothetical protein
MPSTTSILLFKRQKIKIIGSDESIKEIEASVLGPFAIHLDTYFTLSDGKCVITHIKTGRKVISSINSILIAKRIVRELLEHYDLCWNFGEFGSSMQDKPDNWSQLASAVGDLRRKYSVR